jgi:uncharacterized membrane protein
MKIPEENPRQRIKLPLSSHDWVIEFIGLVFLVFLFIMPLRYFNDLPVRIPVHFDAAESPDNYGSPATLWILPLTGLVLWVAMTALGAETGLGKLFLPAFLTLTFGVIIIYLVKANRNRNQT